MRKVSYRPNKDDATTPPKKEYGDVFNLPIDWANPPERKQVKAMHELIKDVSKFVDNDEKEVACGVLDNLIDYASRYKKELKGSLKDTDDCFVNRFEHPIPENADVIEIKTHEGNFTCCWMRNATDKTSNLIGLAKSKEKGIGFYAWKTNDSEFVYYKVIKYHD